MTLNDSLGSALAERKKLGRYRQRRTLESAQGVEVSVDGRQVLNFCSNDYLGLASDENLRAAMVDAVAEVGVGSGASHLVCGHSEEHHALEQELADFCGRDRALLFSTGYMANIGVLQAILGRGDAVFEDRLNHASLIDGALLSRAQFHRYPHLGLSSLSAMLAKNTATRKLIVTDGVFSMDGDVAPLKDLADLARQHEAWLMVDDAHGFGCLGTNGAGLTALHGLDQERVPILVGTLGKALGGFGAFVAGSDALIETLIQFARSYIYTTAMPPAVAAAVRASLACVQTQAWRRDTLSDRIDFFRQASANAGLELTESNTAIQPVFVGSDHLALALSDALLERGFWVTAIRPPTVPEGTARLRITLSSAHTEAQISALVACLATIRGELMPGNVLC